MNIEQRKMVRFPELKYLNFIHKKKKKKKFLNFLHRGLKKGIESEYDIHYDQILTNIIRNDYFSKKVLI